MEKTKEKQVKKIGEILKEYIIPALISFAIAVSTYTAMRITIETIAVDLANLETKVSANEEKSNTQYNELIQRIAGMEAKIDYIYEWVTELRSE
jgi:flagellar capping protein FliD